MFDTGYVEMFWKGFRKYGDKQQITGQAMFKLRFFPPIL
jgi:hypothetical protein